jgi:hypothetical protein
MQLFGSLLLLLLWPTWAPASSTLHMTLACLVAAAGFQFGPMVTSERSTGLKRVVPTLDVGVGLAFELDTAELQPQVRALSKRASVFVFFSDVAADVSAGQFGRQTFLLNTVPV